MADIPRVNASTSTWIDRPAPAEGTLVDVDHYLGSPITGPTVLYAASARDLANETYRWDNVVALACPTSSPFSHDANLLRGLARRMHVPAVLGLQLNEHERASRQRLRIEPTPLHVLVGERVVLIQPSLSGSDEALACLTSRTGVCYRPTYLYDRWLGEKIGSGLSDGVGVLVSSGSSASLDAQGRVWLMSGPLPRQIAEWIFANRVRYLGLLADLAEGLDILNRMPWSDAEVLTAPVFLSAFKVNCQVAPFVGFPLFSLTVMAVESDGAEKLDACVSSCSDLLSSHERTTQTVKPQTFQNIVVALNDAARKAHSCSDSEVAGFTILMSDVRRVVIDNLRRGYSSFREHTRHRKIA